jgi:signal transduction histidine kinase
MTMALEQILNYSITIFALFLAMLAWIAKIKWSNEFKAAKDAEIAAKIAQMDIIKEKVHLYESIISKDLIDYSQKSIDRLENLLKQVEQSKQEEIKRLIQEIKDKEEKLNQFESSIDSDIFLKIGHRFRSPISSIFMFIMLLKKDDLSEEDRMKFIDYIYKSAEELLQSTYYIQRFSISIGKEKSK